VNALQRSSVRARSRSTTLSAPGAPITNRIRLHHPQPSAGRLTLVWGNGQNTAVAVPEREWQTVAREVDVINIDGGHADLLNEHLENLSAALTEAMADRRS
jgi:thioesterase domain-containing protein